MFLEKSSVFKQFSHRKIPVRQADRDRPDIYFDKVEFTLSFDRTHSVAGLRSHFSQSNPHASLPALFFIHLPVCLFHTFINA